jgi:hypothetical protein
MKKRPYRTKKVYGFHQDAYVYSSNNANNLDTTMHYIHTKNRDEIVLPSPVPECITLVASLSNSTTP